LTATRVVNGTSMSPPSASESHAGVGNWLLFTTRVETFVCPMNPIHTCRNSDRLRRGVGYLQQDRLRNGTKKNGVEWNMKMFKIEREEGTHCGGCNWEASIQYVIADTEKQARSLIKSGDAGLCGDCMCDMLSEAGYDITRAETPKTMKTSVEGNEVTVNWK